MHTTFIIYANVVLLFYVHTVASMMIARKRPHFSLKKHKSQTTWITDITAFRLFDMTEYLWLVWSFSSQSRLGNSIEHDFMSKVSYICISPLMFKLVDTLTSPGWRVLRFGLARRCRASCRGPVWALKWSKKCTAVGTSKPCRLSGYLGTKQQRTNRNKTRLKQRQKYIPTRSVYGREGVFCSYAWGAGHSLHLSTLSWNKTRRWTAKKTHQINVVAVISGFCLVFW